MIKEILLPEKLIGYSKKHIVNDEDVDYGNGDDGNIECPLSHVRLFASPNASGGLTPLSPPSELQEIPVAIREQSGVLCFHSR